MRIRNQRDLVRYDLAYQVDERPDGIAFDVELRGDAGTYETDVRITDVTLVRTGVHGDTFGAEPFAVPRGLFDIRKIASAGIAEGGYLVYVDTKSCHVPII